MRHVTSRRRACSLDDVACSTAIVAASVTLRGARAFERFHGSSLWALSAGLGSGKCTSAALCRRLLSHQQASRSTSAFSAPLSPPLSRVRHHAMLQRRKCKEKGM